MQRDQVERYLRLLGVAPAPPSSAALAELVGAHLCRVPFENVSKLYYHRTLGLTGVPGIERFLDGIERRGFGGTCYCLNGYLHELLVELGYRATLCGADMSAPDVHVVSFVELDGRELLVDVGYAAPFRAPIPRDLGSDHVVELGLDRYVLHPRDAAGRSRLDLVRNGRLQHGYLAKPQPRRLEELAPVIADSYRSDATFMNALLLTRFCADRSVVIRNLTVTEHHGAATRVRTLATRDEVVEAVQEVFGIPPDITRDVVRGLPRLNDP